MNRHLACAVLPALVGLGASPAPLHTRGGAWQSTHSPPVLSQTSPASSDATAWLTPPGDGPCWRGVLETGPYPGPAGFRCAADATGAGGMAIELRSDTTPALVLRDAAGKILWQDPGVGWNPYTPVWLEAVIEPGRVRAQMLAADGKELLAQSPWLPCPADTEAGGAGMSLAAFTSGNTARFTLLQRADQPLRDYTPDNPSALRLPGSDGRWLVIGDGAWRWRDVSRQAILQTRVVERTSALQTDIAPRDGTWRCRLRLHQGTRGGGMLLHADKDLAAGFTIWLGGTYGNGRLMLYRSPGNCLWSGPDGVWKWDTDYVLETTCRDHQLRARLLAADGTTVLAESPAVDVPKGDWERRGMVGFQTWRGTAEFAPEVAAAQPVAQPAGSATPTDLGRGWRADGGQWTWVDDTRQRLVGAAPDGIATVRTTTIQGGRGLFRCRVRLAGARAVALLFQLSPDGREGFEARFGNDGFALRTADGQTLWQGGESRCAGAGEYILEGVVSTDRIRIRLLDAAGESLAESVERYVSDTNNTRTGALGLRCEGGSAEFREWNWTSE